MTVEWVSRRIDKNGIVSLSLLGALHFAVFRAATAAAFALYSTTRVQFIVTCFR